MAKGRILIVEDDFITIKLLQKMLSNNSYDIVNCVTNGMEAIETIKNMPVDLVLMDIGINGDADGLEIAKIMKTHYNTPSIFITSHSDLVTIDKAIETGAFGFIVKPFNNNELLIAIRMALYRFSVSRKLNQDLVDISMQINDIRNDAITDALTKTYNRKGYLEKAALIDKEDNFPLGIFTLNINGLGAINKNYGIDIGDMMLIKMASELKMLCGSEAIIARSGADGFKCLMPKVDIERIEILHDHLIEKCKREMNFPFPWSFSFGYEIKREQDQQLEELVVSAENKMNWHKLIQPDSIRNSILSSAFISFVGKTHETKEHSIRLKEHSTSLGRKLHLDHHSLVKLTILSDLHDIGKIGIPESILTKAGKLTDNEWNVMKMHSEIGCKIVKAIVAFSDIADDVLSIHERWDGKGYPNGLVAEQIPLNSRIVAIVDAYDAMTNDRVYRKAMCKEAALLEIERNAGIQFDPTIAVVFVKMMREDDSDDKNTSTFKSIG